MRLARITWKLTATTEHRRACGAYLRARGLLPIPVICGGGYLRDRKLLPIPVICGGGYVWAIKRSIDEQGAAK